MHGPDPAWGEVLPTDGTPALETWAGDWNSGETVAAGLALLEPLTTLLTLAGYDVAEVVAWLGRGGAASADQVVSVSLPELGVSQGTSQAWPDAAPASFVGLRVAPRTDFGFGPDTASCNPIDLSGVDALVDPALAGIVREFDTTTAGWWLVPVVAGDGGWDARLASAIELLRPSLAQIMAAAWTAGGGTLEVPASVGLLALWHPSSLQNPTPSDEEHETLEDRIIGLVAEVVAMIWRQIHEVPPGAGAALGLETFLLQESAPHGPREVLDIADPRTVATRLEELRLAFAAADPAPDPEPGELAEWAELLAHLRSDPDAPATPYLVPGDLEGLRITEFLFVLQLAGLVDVMQALGGGAELYGGWDLQYEDSDHDKSYAGGDPQPSDAGGRIAALRADLATLGFGNLCEGDGDAKVFGNYLQFAVRELQAYAKLETVARELEFAEDEAPDRYVERLESHANPMPYRGPISGVVDLATRSVIAAWKGARFRCPLVVEAWNVNAATWLANAGTPRGEIYVPQDGGGFTGVLTEPGMSLRADGHNVWRYDSHGESTSVYFTARDFSGLFPLPEGVEADDLTVLGRVTTTIFGTGPYTDAKYHAWPEAELRPDTLWAEVPGDDTRPADQAKWSTFRLLRAIGERECNGGLDVINAYDAAYLSLGPYHWTICVRPEDAGELWGFVAWLQETEPDAYEAVWGRWGVRPQYIWDRTGHRYWWTNHRKYARFLALQDANGDWAAPAHAKPSDQALIGNPMRSWHWMYRVEMGTRCLASFRQAMWTACRLRVRDVLATQWDGVTHFDNDPDQPLLTVGDVLTSEKAVTMLVRWHVWRPADLFDYDGTDDISRASNDNIRTPIVDALADMDPAVTVTDALGDEHEEAMFTALRDQCRAIDEDHEAFVDHSVDPLLTWAEAGIASRFDLDLDQVLHQAPGVAGAADTRADAGAVPPAVTLTLTSREVRASWLRHISVEAESDNDALLPNDAITIEVDGVRRRLSFAPVAEQTGTAEVTVTADDGYAKRSVRFRVAVGDALPGAPLDQPDPAQIGLSPRRGSFRFDATFMPDSPE